MGIVKNEYKKVNPRSTKSLPAQIKEALLDKIASGALEPGERIPSETRLAESFGVSRITARQALMELISEGALVRAHGKGTFIAEKPGPADSGGANPVMVITPNLRTSFYHDLISGLEKELSRNNFGLLLRSVNEDPLEEKSCLEKAFSIGARGAALFAESYSSGNLELLRKINSSMPFVALDVAVRGLMSDLIVSDDRKGAHEMTKHLVELGNKKILHLAGPPGDSSAEERAAGYADALAEAGEEPAPGLIRATSWHFEEGYFETKKFFISSGEKATAVFAANDEVCAGAYKALVELGFKVPDDIALAGYGNLACGRFIEVPLTTVDQSAPSLGEAAAALLLEKIRGERPLTESRTVRMPTKLLIRESCGINLKNSFKGRAPASSRPSTVNR